MDKQTLLARSDNLFYSPEQRIDSDYGLCEACGAYGVFEYKEIITNKLAKQWRLTKRQQHDISARESMYCMYCTSSYRLRKQAASLVRCVAEADGISLEESISRGDFNSLLVAEINSCGVLHGILASIPNLKYSEYGSTSPKIPHQDIMNLTYPSNHFDVVLTSDTLEHIPDFKAALKETYRVLKPGGIHLFTTPVLLDRKTVKRALLDTDGKLINKKQPSYHGAGQPDYLVINEFGYDFLEDVESQGFELTVDNIDLKDLMAPGYVFIARKPKDKKLTRKKTIITDLENEEKARQYLTRVFRSDEYKISLVPKKMYGDEYQINKLRWLANKNKLTHDHIANLESINRSYLIELANLRAKIHELESRNIKYLAKQAFRRLRRSI